MIPVLVMLLALVSPSIEMSTLSESETPQATSGRQTGLTWIAVDIPLRISSNTILLFTLDINDDWGTGVMDAKAWVNGSKSAIVRDNLDSLFEGVPGGDDDWISTDEREAVRSIGPKCIADMETRLGIREGPSHRGNVDGTILNSSKMELHSMKSIWFQPVMHKSVHAVAHSRTTVARRFQSQ